jgi:cysteine synthase
VGARAPTTYNVASPLVDRMQILPSSLGFPGMYDKVEQLQKELPNVHVLNQVTNKANSKAHFRLTGMVKS